jgi:hypothetical protein
MRPMRPTTVSYFAALAIVLAACGGDDVDGNQSRIHDAAVADAAEMIGCNDFPYPDDPMCPEDQRFCCPYTLEQPFYCSAVSQSPTGFACREHPIQGLLLVCDPADGSGCPSEAAICCVEHLGSMQYSYCTDHAYVGPGWTCSSH